jgi:S-DNA-T family DNA segregation ATPase FtsK/SpoIIIE
MATSTRSNSRARGNSGSRTATARSTSSRTAPTKRLPRAKAVPEPEHGILAKAWLGFAHIAGGAFRVLGQETLEKDQRRDGVPFFLLVLAVAGAIVEWFNPTSQLATSLDAWTFGGLFGRVAFALPVIMLLFAAWLFRHPSSVHDNTRIGIGGIFMLSSIAALCHIAGGQPQPGGALSKGGGIIGWLIANPLLLLGKELLAIPVAVIVLVLSLFIITKTPPNKIG